MFADLIEALYDATIAYHTIGFHNFYHRILINSDPQLYSISAILPLGYQGAAITQSSWAFYLPLLLSAIGAVTGAATYGNPFPESSKTHLNTPIRREHLQGRQRWPPPDELKFNLPLKPRVRKRAIEDELATARQLVQNAQVNQGAKNHHRFKNPVRAKFTLRPVPKSTKNLRVSTLATDALADADLSEAAALIAEFEAPMYNETLPDLDTGFPKIQKRQGGGGFWMEDFGAVGDGRTDNTVAINLAISSGDSYGANCGSSTVKPALVYFPSGTYLVSRSIVGYYNTQLVGNPNGLSIIRAASSFIGLSVISSNVYIEGQGGGEWYINQNNFMR
ncbi:hypothetical protein TWF594_001673 [Orbilia oligospora]|nr:hypothetical protein TWF594_001673 [Orbilia oligospora]